MLLLEIQENIIKAQNALRQFESNTVYKVYKTISGGGGFEQELRTIYTELIGLRNSFISHTEAIIKVSENKDLLMLIDTGYFERYANAASVESLVRIVSLNNFVIPETSLRVIAENRQVVAELQAVNSEIRKYNNIITDFRQRRNKFYITMYKVPNSNELPDVITATVSVEGMLPNAQILNNFTRNKMLSTPQKNTLSIQAKNEDGKINITKKSTEPELNKITITKKK
jgi:hypothetical protein